MTTSNYISLEDAAQQSNLALTTLQRFIDAGYLAVNKGNKDSTEILIADLKETFGLEFKSDAAEPEGSAQHSPDSTEHHGIVIEQVQSPDVNAKISESETSYLDRVVELQEQLLADKEIQLSKLEADISWLKERIIKLESQAEKDKVLLLSSNQTLNQMLSLREPKKSLFKKAIGIFANDQT